MSILDPKCLIIMVAKKPTTGEVINPYKFVPNVGHFIEED
jgi:hypothetical protein